MAMTDMQRQNVLMGAVRAEDPRFLPPETPWEELEAAREAHERALEEHAGIEARRRTAAEEERQLQEHLKSVQAAKQAADEEARTAVKHSALGALQVVAERGEEWLAQIAEERAAALAEHEELLAQAAAAKERAHQHDAVEAWLQQAMSSSTPQPFGSVAENQTARGARGFDAPGSYDKAGEWA